MAADPVLLVAELAKAVADGEFIDWAEVERRVNEGHPSSKAIRNLRLIDQLATAGRSSSRLLGVRPRVAPVLVLFALVAGLQVAAAVGAVVTGSGAPPGVPAWLLLATMAAFLAGGVVVVFAGRWDPRTAPLGGLFLCIASAAAQPFVRASAPQVPGLAVLSIFLLECFLPFFMWRFVQRFPRVVRLERRGAWIGLVAWVSLVVGCVLLAVNAMHILLPGSALDGPSLLMRTGTSAYWLLLFVLALPGPIVVFARSRFAEDEEKRRVRVFLLGLALGLLPMFFMVLAEMVIPGMSELMRAPRNRMLGSLVVFGSLLTLPVTLSYGAVARHLFDFRVAVHRAAQLLLARGTLWVVAVLPLAFQAVVLWRNRQRPLAEILGQPPTPALIFVALAGIGLLALRKRLLSGLESSLLGRRVAPGEALAGLSRGLATVRDADELRDVLQRHATHLLQTESCHLLVRREADSSYVSVDPGCRGLEGSSAVLQLANASPEPISLDLRDKDSWLPWLPESERLWAADCDAKLLVPLQRGEDECLGLVVFGPLRSGLAFREVDRQLAAAIASAVSLALNPMLEGVAVGSSGKAGGGNDDPAHECFGCGRVVEGQRALCGCGRRLGPAAIPFRLAGKFELIKVLGEGGMGRVYLARDLALERLVALKTLPRLRSRGLLRLRREARSMARLIHPHLALIFGVETWRGVPVLVVEYLSGGPLSGRIGGGTSPREVVGLGIAMARALDALHSRGMLHRDVKPANIAFAADGEPKLLDFGLVQMLEEAQVDLRGVAVGITPPDQVDGEVSAADGFGGQDALQPDLLVGADRARLTQTGHVVGTPLYLSPEMLTGAQPSAAQDLWALSMVLWQVMAGYHPFRGLPIAELLDSWTWNKLPDLGGVCPDWPEELVELVMRGLSLSPEARPGSARELLHDLDAIQKKL